MSTKSSIIIIPDAITTDPTLEPEYNTPTGITATFLGIQREDATLFEVGGAYVLVDTSSILDKAKLVKRLKSMRIKKLEYLILTNTKSDKVGRTLNIFNNFQVDNLILPSGVNDNTEFDTILQDTMYVQMFLLQE